MRSEPAAIDALRFSFFFFLFLFYKILKEHLTDLYRGGINSSSGRVYQTVDGTEEKSAATGFDCTF